MVISVVWADIAGNDTLSYSWMYDIRINQLDISKLSHSPTPPEQKETYHYAG